MPRFEKRHKVSPLDESKLVRMFKNYLGLNLTMNFHYLCLLFTLSREQWAELGLLGIIKET